MRADEELQAQALLQQVDLLDDRRRGDVQPLRRLVEAARLRDAEKRFKLGIVHGNSSPMIRRAEVSSLMIGRDDVLQRDVRIAIAGGGILFRNRQRDRAVRAGMDAGETGLAMAGRVHRPAVLHADRAGRTDLFTDAASDASAG